MLGSIMSPAIRLTAIDPHNLAATPSGRASLVKGVLAAVALILIPGAKENEPAWLPFLSMFVLALLVAPAFTAPERLREDEEASNAKRWLEATKSSVASAVLMKGLSLVLAFLTSWMLGAWWFGLVILVGAVLLWSKGMLALVMIQADEGEFKSAEAAEREAALGFWSKVVARGEVSYVVSSVGCAALVFSTTDIQPANWTGWTGLILGALASPVLDSLDSAGWIP
jgi:hypothetical protein